MIRLFVFAIVTLSLGWGFSWLADRPGLISITWQNQLLETSLMVAATAIVALIFAVMFLWWLIQTIWTSPHSMRRFFRARKRDRGYQALSTGLIAAGAGNALLARKMTARARGLLRADQEPLIHLLEAQTALIEGRHEEAREKFAAMAEDPETREIGLRGLYIEARRLGANDAARQYAEAAAETAPYLPWAAEATLEYRCQAGRWEDAMRLLDQQRIANVIDRKQADRWKAVLLTARAGERLEGDPKGARDDAKAALKLARDLVPAGIIAAKSYLREDNVRKAASVIEGLWKNEPHPELAATYVRARSGDSAADRLKRAEKLEALKPNNPESLLAVAQAALDTQDFARARSKAEAALRMDPRESAYMLLADIEESETGDQGRIRHWMAQALRAPRDPSWVADGVVSERWLPVSPVTGRLDAFEWKRPFGQLEGPIEEGTLAAETALSSLPAIRTDVEDQRSETPPAEPRIDPMSETSITEEPPLARKPPLTVVSTPQPVAVEPKAEPLRPVPPATVVTGEAGASAEKSGDEDGADPFNGRPPDDPGVKDERNPAEPNTRLKLF
ncbi:heme biosynthesis HemY N-terminal domain-containing protein [Rhizobium sp. SAFR-030]|uniref:heme biosynthesis protein HemY n=1 Tax=Rhizobium sp. SAFR-030 TaxID=3387277 RepID=UPI003F7D82CD